MFSIREHLRNYYNYLESALLDAFKEKKDIISSNPINIPIVTIDLSEDITERPTIIIPSDIEVITSQCIEESKNGSYFVANENFKKFKGPSRKRLDGPHRGNPNNEQMDLSKRPSSKIPK